MPFIRRKPIDTQPTETANDRRIYRTARQLAHGHRSVVDVIACGQIRREIRALVLDGRYYRVLAINDWPRYVAINWLESLLEVNQRLDVSIHVEPLDPMEVERVLRTKQVQLESDEISRLRSGTVSSAQKEAQLEEIQTLRSMIARGEQRLYSVRMYVLVSAETPERLEDAYHAVCVKLAEIGLGSYPVYFEQDLGWHSVLPEGRALLDWPRRNIQSEALATMMPFTSGALNGSRGVYYGDNRRSNSMVIYDPFSGLNANCLVLGSAGRGKSYLVKTVLIQLLWSGAEARIIDPDGEYGRLCTALGGQVVRHSSTSKHHINPFDLATTPVSVDDDDAKDPLTEKIAHLHTLIDWYHPIQP